MLTFRQGTLTDNYLSLNLCDMLQKTAALVVLVIDYVCNSAGGMRSILPKLLRMVMLEIVVYHVTLIQNLPQVFNWVEIL